MQCSRLWRDLWWIDALQELTVSGESQRHNSYKQGLDRGRYLPVECHQCRRSDIQYELQTPSTFWQRKMATPLKRGGCVCAWFDIQGERIGGKKGGMAVPHRFFPPAHVMWLGVTPQLLPPMDERRCWVGEGLNGYSIKNLCTYIQTLY